MELLIAVVLYPNQADNQYDGRNRGTTGQQNTPVFLSNLPVPHGRNDGVRIQYRRPDDTIIRVGK